jgi:hypothetical protein
MQQTDIQFISHLAQFHYNLTTITGTVHAADRYTIYITPRSVLLRMRNVADKSYREKTHFLFSNFFSEIVPFMRYVEKYGTAWHATDGNTAHAHCRMGTQVHGNILRILITLSLQQWLHEFASLYVQCLSGAICYNLSTGQSQYCTRVRSPGLLNALGHSGKYLKSELSLVDRESSRTCHL